MNRLTKTYEDGTFGVAENLPCGENSWEFKRLLINTVGAYESTGLTPGQIYDMDKMFREKCEEVNKLKEQLKAKETVNQLYKTIVSMIGSDKDSLVKELRHYRELKEQGRLIELPFKVGDTVFWVNDWYRTYGDYKIDKEKVIEFCFDGSEIVAYMGGGKSGTIKDVFATREEAENALAANEQNAKQE